MSNIVQVVRKDLDGKNASPRVLENVSMYIRRALVSLHNDGALPPKIEEYSADNAIQEKRDGNGNLIYNFIFLPDDFLRLDKFIVYEVDAEDNKEEKTYHLVSKDMLFAKRKKDDDRRFFSITDYNIDDERSRKILVLDPYPDNNEWIEVRYFMDGTETPLENLHSRYWESIISKVHQFVGIKSFQEAEREISKESANWRNQEGKDSFNKTHKSTNVNNGLFGKTR